MFFKKDKKQQKKETSKDVVDAGVDEKKPTKSLADFSTDHGVLKGFYISEKASVLNSFNQYVFKVYRSANKNEVKKQVEKAFSVKVKSVKIINLPRKARTLGRHSGFKAGVKKAIVVLKEGYTYRTSQGMRHGLMRTRNRLTQTVL